MTRVIDREGEHAVQVREAVFTPGAIGGHQDLGIAMGGESDSGALEGSAKVREVVDFAVESDCDLAGASYHRLMSAAGQIDYGQPAMA